MTPAAINIRVQRWVLVVSVVLLLVKLVAYFLTNSVAILTDALESIVNVIAGVMGLYSLTISAKPRDFDHPYGHGKIELLSAGAEGVMVFVAGAITLFEAAQQLASPHAIEKLDIGIFLVAASGLVNFVMGSLCIRTGRRNNSTALIASGRHLHTDTYSTVGILIGLVLIYFTGIQWLDSAIAIIFSFLILYTGFKIVRSSVAGIMDESDRELLQNLVKVADDNRAKNWIDLHNVRIIKYGNTLHVDCHLTVPWYLNVHEAHEEIEKLAQIVRNEFSHSIELFVHSDGCLPISCPICIKDDCPVRHHAHKRRVVWTVENIQQDKKHQVETR